MYSNLLLDNDVRPSRDYKGKSILSVLEDFVVIDLETTGLEPQLDEIIEIGIIRVRSGEIVGQFNSLVKPNEPIGGFITKLTGITNEMLSGAPSIETVLSNAINFIGNNIVIGHNVNFDINFIYDTSMRLFSKPFTNDFIDTLRLSRKLFPEYQHNRLKDLAVRFEIQQSIEHRALGDAIATYKCYKHLINYAQTNGIDLQSLVYKKRHKLSARDISTDIQEFDESSPVFGKLFVFTGTLEKMIRKEAMQLVVDSGGLCRDSVTQKTNYLVLGNNDYRSSVKEGKSTKQKRAEELKLAGNDIEILSENVFYDMINQ